MILYFGNQLFLFATHLSLVSLFISLQRGKNLLCDLGERVDKILLVVCIDYIFLVMLSARYTYTVLL
jgi:hypothetical protein